MKVVAIEDGVMGLKTQIESEGYQVVNMSEVKNADAYIISGMDENITGDMTRVGEGFLINAKGRQPEEIIYDLKKHFRLMQ
jgi:enoyl-[acyl-carrier-protein] reductase (NADH)